MHVCHTHTHAHARTCAELLAGGENGDFLVRKSKKGGDDYILSLKYKDVGTHHMIGTQRRHAMQTRRLPLTPNVNHACCIVNGYASATATVPLSNVGFET